MEQTDAPKIDRFPLGIQSFENLRMSNAIFSSKEKNLTNWIIEETQ